MSGVQFSTLAAAISIAGLTIIYSIYTRYRRKHEQAESFLKLPIIGDLHKSPIEKPLRNWDEWVQEKGAVVSTKLMGMVPIVILNTSEAATELFSRRSQWYNNRPPSVTMDMITGAEPGQCRFTLMHDYDAHLKLYHRLLSPSLGPSSAGRFMPLMELESKQLLEDIIELLEENKHDKRMLSIDAIYPLLERTQSSIILALHYGMRISQTSDTIMREVINVQAKVTYLAANPRLPDMIPYLRHLPSFLSPWKRSANKLFAEQAKLYRHLVEYGKGSRGWNATKQALDAARKYPGVSELDLAFMLATSIQGGMETSPRQMLWLFVAALQNPSSMRKAHDALDIVVGRERLPRFSDRKQLGYIDAIVHELLRWRPVSPGGIPRRADTVDDFDGIRIWKGAVILANAWSIGRDSAVFDPNLGDLHDFCPERWLSHETDGDEVRKGEIQTGFPLPVFGHGRRMCLGKRVALDGLFMQVASLLWAFDIEPARGGVDPWSMRVTGFMTAPSDFGLKLVPRGPWVADVIKKSWQVADKDLANVMGVSTLAE